MTYDLPVLKEIEGPMGVDETGIGDLGLRVFYKPKAGQFEHSSHMIGGEVLLPTATNTETLIGNAPIPFNVLGNDTLSFHSVSKIQPLMLRQLSHHNIISRLTTPKITLTVSNRLITGAGLHIGNGRSGI